MRRGGAEPGGDGPYGALGTEFTAGLSDNIQAAARLGVNTLGWGDIPGLNGLAAGLGLSVSGVSLDYALAPFGVLGMTHRVSLSLSFGKQEYSQARGSRRQRNARVSYQRGLTLSGQTLLMY